MSFQINERGLTALSDAWGSFIEPNCPQQLEWLTHELAHVLDLTGALEGKKMSVSSMIDDLTYAAQDYNEIRASAVTWQVLQDAGLLTSELEGVIRGSLSANVKVFSGPFAMEKLKLMINSRRTRQMAKKIIEHYVKEGVLVRASS